MNMDKKFLLPLLVAATVGSTAGAATSHMQFVETRPGRWDVLVEVVPENGDVLGLSGYAFKVVGQDSSLLSFQRSTLGGVEESTSLRRGFPTPLPGLCTCYSVGNNQATAAGGAEIFGYGIEPVVIDLVGEDDIEASVPLKVGTLTSPTSMTEQNLVLAQIALFPAGYSGLSRGTTVSGEDAGEFFVTITPIPELSSLAIVTVALVAPLLHRLRQAISHRCTQMNGDCQCTEKNEPRRNEETTR